MTGRLWVGKGNPMGWKKGEREDVRSRWMGCGGGRGNMEDRDYRE